MNSAYQPEAWQTLYTVLGGSVAAIAGLLFIAMSLHIETIMRSPILRMRSGANIVGLIVLFTEAAVVLVPQSVAALPAHIEAMMDAFHQKLTPEEQADLNFAYRVVFVPKSANRASSADLAVEFVKPESDEAREINNVLLKEIDKRRYTATQVVGLMQAEGYSGFKRQHHTNLWQALGAKNAAPPFGRVGDYTGTWVWYDSGSTGSSCGLGFGGGSRTHRSPCSIRPA